MSQADGGDNDTQFLLRTMLLLTSPMAWLYWKDYLGLDPADAAATAGCHQGPRPRTTSATPRQASTPAVP